MGGVLFIKRARSYSLPAAQRSRTLAPLEQLWRSWGRMQGSGLGGLLAFGSVPVPAACGTRARPGTDIAGRAVSGCRRDTGERGGTGSGCVGRRLRADRRTARHPPASSSAGAAGGGAGGAKRGPRAVAFEISGLAPVRGRRVSRRHGEPARFGEAIAWEASGWPAWAWYADRGSRPGERCQIVAADLGVAEKRARSRKARRRSGRVRERTGLGEPWPAPMMVRCRTSCAPPISIRYWPRRDRHDAGAARAHAMMADQLAPTSRRRADRRQRAYPKDRGVPWSWRGRARRAASASACSRSETSCPSRGRTCPTTMSGSRPGSMIAASPATCTTRSFGDAAGG